MYSAVFALLIAAMMMLLVILKGRRFDGRILYCKKSELVSIIENISEDSIIQIWIGRNSYEHKRESDS